MIAHSVFASDHSDFAKLGNSFNHAKQHSENSCVSVSSMSNPFGIVNHIDGRKEANLSANVRIFVNILEGTVSILFEYVSSVPDAKRRCGK